MSDLHHLPLLRNPSNLIYICIHAQMGIIRLRFTRYIPPVTFFLKPAYIRLELMH